MYRQKAKQADKKRSKRQTPRRQDDTGVGGFLCRALRAVGIEVGQDDALLIGAIVIVFILIFTTSILPMYTGKLKATSTAARRNRAREKAAIDVTQDPNWEPAVALDMSGEVCFGKTFNGEWEIAGITKAGFPWYKRDTGTKPRRFAYIYFDPDCDGPDHDVGLPAWIASASRPNIEALSDLDGDGICNIAMWTTRGPTYVGQPPASRTPPDGDWKVSCRGVWETSRLKFKRIDKVNSKMFQGWMSVIEKARKTEEWAEIGLTLSGSTATTTTEDELIRVLAAVLRLPAYATRVMTDMQQVAITDIIVDHPDLMNVMLTNEEQQVLVQTFARAKYTFSSAAKLAGHGLTVLSARLEDDGRGKQLLMELCIKSPDCLAKRAKGWITNNLDIMATLCDHGKEGKQTIIDADSLVRKLKEIDRVNAIEAGGDDAGDDSVANLEKTGNNFRNVALDFQTSNEQPLINTHKHGLMIPNHNGQVLAGDGSDATRVLTTKVPGTEHLYVHSTARELLDVKAQLTNMLKQDDYLEGDEWYHNADDAEGAV